jgi:GTP-binding protein
VIDISTNNIDEALKDVDVIAKELKDYDKELGEKDKWYIFNKIDLLNEKELEILKKSVNNKIKKNVYFVSAKEKAGLNEVCENIIEYLRDLQ